MRGDRSGNSIGKRDGILKQVYSDDVGPIVNLSISSDGQPPVLVALVPGDHFIGMIDIALVVGRAQHDPRTAVMARVVPFSTAAPDIVRCTIRRIKLVSDRVDIGSVGAEERKILRSSR